MIIWNDQIIEATPYYIEKGLRLWEMEVHST